MSLRAEHRHSREPEPILARTSPLRSPDQTRRPPRAPLSCVRRSPAAIDRFATSVSVLTGALVVWEVVASEIARPERWLLTPL